MSQHFVLRVTVRDGLAGVNRVVGLVRVRGSGPRSITAWVTSEADTWVIEHTLFASEESLALLHRQLERLPCVTNVQHSLAGPEASSTLQHRLPGDDFRRIHKDQQQLST
jgi:acetolactate synthase regulatory subunit